MDHLVQLIGRLHPLIVHLPIGILVLALTLHVLVWRGKYIAYQGLLPVLWLFGFMTAVLACMAGYALSVSEGYSGGAVDTHMWLGIGLMLFSGAVYLMLIRNAGQALQITTVTAAGLLLLATGHYGGNLTHGESYLTQPLYSLLGLSREGTNKPRQPIEKISDAVIYRDLVEPILDQKCYKCHNADKQKGNLRLDTHEALLNGGKHGEIIVAGNAAASSLYTNLILPEEDDEHMPPKGKPQLTKNEIALIQWWLDQGKASFTDKVSDIKADEHVKVMLASIVKSAVEETADITIKLPRTNVDKADPDVIHDLKKQGIAFTALTADQVFLSANAVNAPDFNDKHMNLLLKIANHILWLDLSDTKITDESISKIAAFKHLRRLSLDNTAITDASLAYLKHLPALQYLNLYGTPISDKGLQQLSACKNLRKLYLWKTEVTSKGIAALQKNIGTIEEINAGNHLSNIQ